MDMILDQIWTLRQPTWAAGPACLLSVLLVTSTVVITPARHPILQELSPQLPCLKSMVKIMARKEERGFKNSFFASCSNFKLISEPPKIMPFTFGSDTMKEGSFAQLSCVVTEGDEPLTISWSFHGHNLTKDLGIVTTNIGTRTSLLMINSVGHRHMGQYTCTAFNTAGTSSHSAELKVNGKFLTGKEEKGNRKGLDISKLLNAYFVHEMHIC